MRIRRRVKLREGWVWSERGAPAGKGDVRWIIYYRPGGRGRSLYGGTFTRKGDAQARERLILRELAEGRDPRASFVPREVAITGFAALAERWWSSRHHLAQSSRHAYRRGRNLAVEFFGDADVAAMTHLDAQAFLAFLIEHEGEKTGGHGFRAATVRAYFLPARLIVDELTGEGANPFRDRRVRMPAPDHEDITPPPWAHVAAVLPLVPRQVRLALILLERTGMRVGEACRLTWGDLDVPRCQLRVRRSSTKSAAGRRMVPIDAGLMDHLDGLLAREDRDLADSIIGRSAFTVQGAVRDALPHAGVPTWTPHDLRHRRISLRVSRNENPIIIANEVGHSSAAITLGTYAHVLVDMTDPPTATILAEHLPSQTSGGTSEVRA